MKTNNYKTIYKAILLIAIMFAFYSSAHAQQKILLLLTMPAPDKLGVSDLWKMEVDNTSKETITVIFEGYASEEKTGMIVEGTSKQIHISPGKHKYGYDDFKTGGQVNWKNNDMKNVLLGTGNASEGNYTICVTAKDSTGKIVGQERCIEHSVSQQGSITLISPEDGAELKSDQPLMF